MKVTLISVVFPHPEKGVWPGIERHVGELSRALVKEGADVSVLTTFWNGGEARDSWEGVSIYRVSDVLSRWGRAATLMNLHVRSFMRNVLGHQELLRSSDAIHTFLGLPGAARLAALGVPLFASFQHRDRPRGPLEALLLVQDFRAERRFFQVAEGVFVGSSESRRVLAEEYRVDSSRVHVVPYGVDAVTFRPPTAPRPRLPHEARPEGVRLLYVGPLIHRKGLRTLVEALPLVLQRGVPFTLSLVGRGPEEPTLRRLAQRHGVVDRVRFVGHVVEPGLIGWYQDSDIFVFPSTREGFGFVLVEAMACGLPVVTTQVPPMPEVVGEAAVLVPPSDPGALADGIVEVARDPDMRDRFSREGRRRVEERYLWSRVARQTLDHYDRARATRTGAA